MIRPGRSNTVVGDTMVKDNAKIGKIRVFPISFLFARAFPGIRMRKLRGLGLPLGLLSGKPFQFGRNDNRRGLS